MDLNIRSRSLAPLINPGTEKLNQLPPIGAVFPEFFEQREPPIVHRKPIFKRIEAPKVNYKILMPHPPIPNSFSPPASNSRSNSVNYSMPFLYTMQGRLRSRMQTKTYLPRRKRVNTMQLRILNEQFSKNPFPSIEQRSKLSEVLGISAKSIQIWFQNKRQTIRNNEC
jgi:hypothetical protein